jgi:hypothetical protein
MVALGRARKRNEQEVRMMMPLLPEFVERGARRGVPKLFWDEDVECGRRWEREIGKGGRGFGLRNRGWYEYC